MKSKKSDACPGCGKHCPRGAEKCKYGRAYFAKKDAPVHEYKWEAYTQKGSLAWQLLLICRNIKKALRSQKLSEEEIFAPLTPQEKEELAALVKKLDFRNAAQEKPL